MEGIQLDSTIAMTGPGTLHHASRVTQGDRIVRTIDPRYCDQKFRQSLSQLTGRQYARMFPIEGEGWLGLQYGITYQPASSWEPLAAHFQRLHWRLRLHVIVQICEVLELWHNGPVHPLSLNLYNVVMAKDAGHWFPWLLPCPPVDFTSPCDLFGAAPAVISATAPEVIRGVSFRHHAQDMYALGTLAIYALGCRELPYVVTDGERIEAQVCGSYLACDLRDSDVEPSLQEMEAMRRLVRTIKRYTYITPDARPTTPADLAEACQTVIEATDPMMLAQRALQHNRPIDALNWLGWGFKNFGENRDGHMLAAEICEAIEDYPQALQHLDIAISLANEFSLDDLIRRVGLRSRYILSLPEPPPGGHDQEGDLLLHDVEMLKRVPPQVLERRNLPYLSAAMVYRRRQDLARAAQELYEAANILQTDMQALWMYGECLRDMRDTERVAGIVQEAHRRIALMTANQMMSQEEARRWLERFALLLES